MTGGTLVLEVGESYEDESGLVWHIIPDGTRQSSLFSGISDAKRLARRYKSDGTYLGTKFDGVTGGNLIRKLAKGERLTLEVGAQYVDEKGYNWDVKHELYLRSRHGAKVRKYFAVNAGNGLVERYFNANGTFLRDAVEFDSPYPVCNLIRKVEPKSVEAAPPPTIAEELYEIAKKYHDTEAVAQRLIERATEAAKNGETSIGVETYVFYDQRLQAELYKHGFAVKGKYIQSSFSASSSYLDKVYLSWGE